MKINSAILMAALVGLAMVAIGAQAGDLWLEKNSAYTGNVFDLQKVIQLAKEHDIEALLAFQANGNVAINESKLLISLISKPVGVAIVDKFFDSFSGTSDLVQFHFVGSPETYWTLKRLITETPETTTHQEVIDGRTVTVSETVVVSPK